MSILIITSLFSTLLAFIIGTALGFFKDFFAVKEDPLIAKVREALPGANCGACGFPGCDNYASAVASGGAPGTACTVGGPSAAAKIAAITGKTGAEVVQTAAVLACQGSSLHTPLKGVYTGIKTCRGAKLAGGTKLCSWGCLGFGDCVNVCKFGALTMGENRLPKVNYAKCTGCGLCASECPQALFQNVPVNRKGALVLCSNKNIVKAAVAKSCKISCRKCGLCVKNCPKQCITLDALIPAVDYSKCDSCGTCADKCPTKVFKVIERDIFAY